MGDLGGARPSETGSRASMEPASSLHPTGVDPARWLLWASQGEYSDRIEWAVALYEREEDAMADVLLGEALHRELFRKRYVPWGEHGKLWATTKGQQLRSIMGEQCYESEDLHLTCCQIEFRSASAIEARRAETAQTGSVHESAVPTADAPNLSPPSDKEQ